MDLMYSWEFLAKSNERYCRRRRRLGDSWSTRNLTNRTVCDSISFHRSPPALQSNTGDGRQCSKLSRIAALSIAYLI
ncbi:hypothetical protein FOZ63_022934 [Perkinsus olseni]|uniref:Uncharacterized protein n=1 Tax=Perkinsus olseni TaxID=32597 RepID=A0A7J6SWZ0_PEROL|nr:hypothetical protein FOZ63_022934 [Perkinsus olseni]